MIIKKLIFNNITKFIHKYKKYKKKKYELEIKKKKEFTEIEITKFEKLINSIGKETLIAISRVKKKIPNCVIIN